MIVTAGPESFNFATYCQIPLQQSYTILHFHSQCMSTCSLLWPLLSSKVQTPVDGGWWLTNSGQKGRVLWELSFIHSFSKYLLSAYNMPVRDTVALLTGFTIWDYKKDTGTTIICGKYWQGSTGCLKGMRMEEWGSLTHFRGRCSGRASYKKWLLSWSLNDEV